MRKAGTKKSRLPPNTQMWPSAKGASFFVGVRKPASLQNFIFFNKENAICGTLKQQITPGLEKTKGDISEI